MFKTPLNNAHRQLDAKMIDFGGWDMPVYYSNLIEEHSNTRENAGIFDISHMGEIFIEGKEALDFADKIFTRKISGKEDGKVMLSVLCNENGGILDDLTVYKFSDEKLMVVVNASNTEKDFNWMKEKAAEFGSDVEIKNESENFGKIDLQGPKAQEILQKLLKFDLNEIKYYHFKVLKRENNEEIVSRTGYTGEDGFEIYVPAKKTEEVWNSIITIGNGLGLKPAGLGARDTLRLEAGMMLYGNDIDEQHTPLEAPYVWVVDFEKPDFIGKNALEKQKKGGIKQKLIGFEMIDRGIARHGYKILADGTPVGEVTSGSLSPTLKKNIGIGYISADYARIGNEIGIEIRDKLNKAKVVDLPFYKRKK